jgi:hypothetical protein
MVSRGAHTIQQANGIRSSLLGEENSGQGSVLCLSHKVEVIIRADLTIDNPLRGSRQVALGKPQLGPSGSDRRCRQGDDGMLLDGTLRLL